MPFTFAHPAAVLPAKYLPEKWVSMSALVVGSITPDLEYFTRMKNLSIYSHTWLGLLCYDMPVGFAFIFVYHLLIRDGLIRNLPLFLKSRLSRYSGFNWIQYLRQNFLVVMISLAAGIATHIAWDGFTHRTGCFVAVIPWLKQSTYVEGVGLTHYYILQGISSLVGMTIVMYALYKIPKDESVVKGKILKYWAVVSILTVLIVIVRALIGEPFNHLWMLAKQTITVKFYTGFFSHPTSVDLVMTIIGSFIIALAITPVIVKPKS
jgi:hypothetical protein